MRDRDRKDPVFAAKPARRGRLRAIAAIRTRDMGVAPLVSAACYQPKNAGGGAILGVVSGLFSGGFPASFSAPNRNAECDTGPDFLDGSSVDGSRADREVNGHVFARLSNQSHKPRHFGFLIELFIKEDLRHGTHFPLRRSLKDGAHEQLGAMIAGQRRLQVKMNSSPFPTARK
jgi:hypothetical protein